MSAQACVGVGLLADSAAAARTTATSMGEPRASYGKTVPGEPGDQERWGLWPARAAYASEWLNRARAPVRGGGARWRHGGA
jgi:hypothetical protein